MKKITIKDKEYEVLDEVKDYIKMLEKFVRSIRVVLETYEDILNDDN